MGFTLLGTSIFGLFLLANLVEGANINIAAKPNADVGPELMNAWKEACAATAASTTVIPKDTYPMSQVVLIGPCKAPIELQIPGTLKASSDPKTLVADKEWLTFRYVDKLTVSGGGVLDY